MRIRSKSLGMIVPIIQNVDTFHPNWKITLPETALPVKFLFGFLLAHDDFQKAACHGKLQRYARPLAREIPRYQRASVFQRSNAIVWKWCWSDPIKNKVWDVRTYLPWIYITCIWYINKYRYTGIHNAINKNHPSRQSIYKYWDGTPWNLWSMAISHFTSCYKKMICLPL